MRDPVLDFDSDTYNCVFADDRTDTDGDGIIDELDNCPLTANTDQLDSDGDGIGDVCDNCPSTANTDQLDSDADGIGDVCDNCPSTANTDQLDSDADGIGDVCDNCPLTANTDQLDSDADGIGDVCDNCPLTANDDQLDSDGDGIGDVCDNCPSTSNADQSDRDSDGIGDVCEVVTIPVCNSGESLQQGLIFSTFDTEGYEDIPSGAVEYQLLVNNYSVPNKLLGKSITSSLYQEQAYNINPHFDSIPHDDYLSLFQGYLYIDSAGYYDFAVDGNNAIEVLIDGDVVTGDYRTSGMLGYAHEQQQIWLAEGYHPVEFRHQEWYNSEGYAFYLKSQDSSLFSIVPSDDLYSCQPEPIEPEQLLEVGQFSLGAQTSHTIKFENTYTTPPLVLVMPTINRPQFGDDFTDNAATALVTSVSTTEATVVQDSPTGNADETMDKLSYLVVAQGKHILRADNGQSKVWLQAGTLNSQKLVRNNGSNTSANYEAVDWDSGHFPQTPVMLTQRQTKNNNEFVTSFSRPSNGNPGYITLDGNVDVYSVPNEETIGWLAIYTDGGSAEVSFGDSGLKIESGSTFNFQSGGSSLSNQCNSVDDYITNDFSTAPYVFASKQSRNGGQGGWARLCQNNADSFSIVIDETQDRKHTIESIAYVAIEVDKPESGAVYYRITHDGEGVTCEPESITIEAFADADYTSLLTSDTTVTLVPDDGWVDGQLLTFTGATEQSLWGVTAPTTLGLTATNAAEVSCVNTGAGDDSCVINFAESGWSLQAQSHVQGCATQNNGLQLKAVRTSASDSKVCEPFFSEQGVSVLWTIDPIIPINRKGDPEFSIQANEITEYQGNPALGTALLVSFDSNGIANLNYKYTDVGQLNLRAYYQESNQGVNQQLNGYVTLNFMPAGFEIAAEAHCINGDSSCNVFKQAGESFELNIAAKCSADGDPRNGSVAKNFRHDGIDFTSSLLSPLPGKANNWEKSVAFTQATIDNDGSVTVSAFSSEVGVFNWQPKQSADISYLSGTIAKESYYTLPIGRFTPAYLRVTQNSPALEPFCGSMSYLGQPRGFASGLAPSLTIEGFSRNDAETENYSGDYWVFNNAVDVSVYDSGASAAVTRQLNYNLIASSQTMNFIDTTVTYDRAATPVIPFDANLGFEIDADSVTDRDAICVKTDANGSCQTVVFSNITGTEWRDGRIQLQSVYGTETQALTIPAEVQYFNTAGRYQRNVEDSCTVIDSSDAVVSNSMVAISGGGTVSAGLSELNASALGQASVVTLEQRLESTLPHLRWWWDRPISEDDIGRQCFAGSTATVCNPKATLTYGRYRGNDRVIYRRSVP
ncbi:DUF6701 domain-containing protein [Ferrimonas lipolytica]|uniref:DUF6701 domain-containing protein n=1 Tax=Ferrimonas lipolytica TaxID=2724191 RepID=UPI0019325968|nr:DUF6701 domain-containing protein [Ferrimonas lipolytica]